LDKETSEGPNDQGKNKDGNKNFYEGDTLIVMETRISMREIPLLFFMA